MIRITTTATTFLTIDFRSNDGKFRKLGGYGARIRFTPELAKKLSEVQKKLAIDNEDFDSAKILKFEIERLKNLATNLDTERVISQPM